MACPVRRRGFGRRGAHVLTCSGLGLSVASFDNSIGHGLMGGLGLRVHLACMALADQGGAAAAGGGAGARWAASAADRIAGKPEFLFFGVKIRNYWRWTLYYLPKLIWRVGKQQILGRENWKLLEMVTPR